LFHWPQFEHHDGWFLVVMGMLFVMFARQYGRTLGGKVDFGLDGSTPSPEQVEADVRRATLSAYLFGAACIAGGVWLLWFR
jgi:hypothetical protein